MKKVIALVLCVVVLAGLVYGAILMNRDEKPIDHAGSSVNAPDKLVYNGSEYPLKRHIQTVLLIGTDNPEVTEEQTEGIPNFYVSTQADFLMLLVMDLQENTTAILQLNRDTMTDVPWLDVFGKFGGTEVKQLCLAFNYGDGGEKSCKNTVDAVSRLLFHAPIDGYIQVPLTAIPVINDLVGGVPVTITEDMTEVNPAFEKGATITLNGQQAEQFVRSRKNVSDGTNIARMERHRAYLDSFQQRAKQAFNSDSAFAKKILQKLADLMQSNLTAQEITDLITRLDKSEISPVRYPEGKLKIGERYYEFYVNEKSLWELVKSMYCE